MHPGEAAKNILLTPQGVAKLTDLGLARATDDKLAAESEAGKAYGTPYYISPEQIRGDVDIDWLAGGGEPGSAAIASDEIGVAVSMSSVCFSRLPHRECRTASAEWPAI